MKSDVDVAPFMDELFAYRGHWSDRRAKDIPMHRDTLAIVLRAPLMASGEDPKEVQRERNTSDYVQFPRLTTFLQAFAREMDGTLARATIVSLKPGGQVHAHVDHGSYYARRDRYHLVLQSVRGSRMRAGGEDCTWRTGELWWFDNKAVHEAFNDSEKAERIHVIFDVLPLGN